MIETIKEDGMAAKWNKDNPNQTIKPGDFIVSVNSVRDSSHKLMEEFRKYTLELVLERQQQELKLPQQKFTVEFTKKRDDLIGLDVIPVEEKKLRIETIKEDCMAAKRNKDNPNQTIKPGDFIVSVNGVRDFSHKLMEEIRKDTLELVLERQQQDHHGHSAGELGGEVLPRPLRASALGGAAAAGRPVPPGPSRPHPGGR